MRRLYGRIAPFAFVIKEILLENPRVGAEFCDKKTVDFFSVRFGSAEIFPIQPRNPGIDGEGRRFAESEQRNTIRDFIPYARVCGERSFQFGSRFSLDGRKPLLEKLFRGSRDVSRPIPEPQRTIKVFVLFGQPLEGRKGIIIISRKTFFFRPRRRTAATGFP